MWKKRLYRAALIFVCLVVCSVASTSTAHAVCSPTGFIDRTFSNTCWSCFFPLSLFAQTVYPGTDTDIVPPAYGDLGGVLCSCQYPYPPYYRIGIPSGYFEPVALIEIVRDPWCFEALGKKTGDSGGGTPVGVTTSNDTHADDPAMQRAYYHAHYYNYPLFEMLGMTSDSGCYASGGADVAYMSEVDPTWSDDVLGAWEFPEAALFADSLVQAACTGDCIASSTIGPLDPLFWCAGCWGSMYPFTGSTTSTGQGDVGVSALIGAKMLAKMHRYGIAWFTAPQGYLCFAIPAPIIVKSQYKFTLIAPVPQLTQPCCHALGRSPMVWGNAKSFPSMGENFVYVLWRLRRCCHM